MNYAIDTADFEDDTTYLVCKLLAILLPLLHLQGGFPVGSFKDGASMLPLSALEERDYMKIS